MNTVPMQLQDARHQFALRFNSIAEQQGVRADGLLFLDEIGEKSTSERIAENQLVTPKLHTDEDRSFVTSKPAGIDQHPCLIVPGLLGDSVRKLVAPLMCARSRLENVGYNIDVAWVNGRTGCQRNATILRDQIKRTADIHGAAVNIIGYSKGCADCLHMLGTYPDTHSSVRSLVSLVGVVHGTPLAKDPTWLLRKFLQYVPIPGVPFGDGRAIVDLSSKVRQQWLADHALPSSIYFASIAAAPQPERVSRVLKGSYNKLSLINQANDSQVIDVDSMLPAGELLAIVNADHWAIALPVRERLPFIARLLVDQNEFPRDVLLRALLEHLGEIQTRQ